MKEHSNAASFVQLSKIKNLKLVPDQVKRTLDAFLSTDDELSLDAPEAHGYESHSGGLVATLEGLADKFVGEQNALEKAEMNAKHAFDMATADITASLDRATG